ncbi:Mobile element protein [Minicystis rosea]|nr:Mobile element protein [Minicystis rosea]
MLPADKKELKKIIGFLDQDYLDSELTEDRFKVSSKASSDL